MAANINSAEGRIGGSAVAAKVKFGGYSAAGKLTQLWRGASRGPYWASGRMPKRVRDEQSPSGWSEVPWHTCCDPVILAAPYVIDLHHDTVARVINSRTLQRSCTNTWRRTPVLSIQLGCGSTCGAAWALAFC